MPIYSPALNFYVSVLSGTGRIIADIITQPATK
jgi:hypothetical protein